MGQFNQSDASKDKGENELSKSAVYDPDACSIDSDAAKLAGKPSCPRSPHHAVALDRR